MLYNCSTVTVFSRSDAVEFLRWKEKAFEIKNSEMQDLRSILLALQKEKLVDIVLTLSETNEDFKNQIVLLVSEIKAPLENISDNNRKLELNQKKYENSLICNNNFLLESVSKTSTPQEKINFFKTLFIGREDVFALRWSNAKSDKSGYSPVCENKSIKLKNR